MKRQWLITGVAVLALVLAVAVGLTQAQGPEPGSGRAPQDDLGTGFTYQGQLHRDGEPVDDTCAFLFSLYEDAGGSSQVGATLNEPGVPIDEGFFTVNLDFGRLTAEARWLGIEVQCPGDVDYVTDNRTCCGHLPGAAAEIHRVTNCMAVNRKSIECAMDLRQRLIGMDETRLD